MTTFFMFFFGFAIMQAAVDMLISRELSLFPLLACMAGFALVLKGLGRLFLWLDRKRPSRQP